MPKLMGSAFRLLASLELAVVLLVILAMVCVVATFLEAFRMGTEAVQWYVYDSIWFVILSGVLALNILAAVLIRFPWKMRQSGFVVAHAGVLMLLGGSIATYLKGIDGQLGFVEGETADSIMLTHRSLLSVEHRGPEGPVTSELSFEPGPFDWREGNVLDFGQEKEDDIRVKVLRFYRHADLDQETSGWIRDEFNTGGPALQFALSGGGDGLETKGWLVVHGDYADRETRVGPLRLSLEQASANSLRDDFLTPPGDLPEKGLLSVHYRHEVHRLAVDENLGKKVQLGEQEAFVEIAEYFADAMPGKGRRLVSRSEEPRNPVLGLQVYLPGREEPLQEIALAKAPTLSLTAAHGGALPVSFWYHHPAVLPPSGVQFLQTPDEKLYYRVAADGVIKSRGEWKEADRIDTATGREVTVAKRFPHARRRIVFVPHEPGPESDAKTKPDAAVLVEITSGESTREIWLRRSDQEHAQQTVLTPRGPMAVAFGYDHLPLGFSLKLVDFKRGMNPGRMGNASFASSVRLIDPNQQIDRVEEIAMNRPLVHGKYWFYQSSFQDLGGGREASVLSVGYDPGRPLKYLGSFLICVGIFVTFYMRRVFSRKAPSS